MVKIALRILLGCLGLTLIAVGGTVGWDIFHTWLPCFQATSYDTPVCFQLQTYIGTDSSESGPTFATLWRTWWMASGGLLLALIAACAVPPLRHLRRALVLAVAARAGGFLLIDYSVTPFLNGGYMSHDSPPGFGLLGSWSLVLAGLILVAGMVWAPLLRPKLPRFLQAPSASTALAGEVVSEKSDAKS